MRGLVDLTRTLHVRMHPPISDLPSALRMATLADVNARLWRRRTEPQVCELFAWLDVACCKEADMFDVHIPVLPEHRPLLEVARERRACKGGERGNVAHEEGVERVVLLVCDAQLALVAGVHHVDIRRRICARARGEAILRHPLPHVLHHKTALWNRFERTEAPTLVSVLEDLELEASAVLEGAPHAGTGAVTRPVALHMHPRVAQPLVLAAELRVKARTS